VLERVSRQPVELAHLDADTLCEDLRLSSEQSAPVLRALVKGRLLEPDGDDRYRPTAILREYANATVVAPLSRARARMLVDRSRALAEEINADWRHSPFRIKVVAVSGSYMSRRQHLPDMCLWLVLRRRANVRTRPWKHAPSRKDGLSAILAAFNALSSFIVVRVVAELQDAPRPFAIVFQSGDLLPVEPVHAWDRFHAWGASISRRLGAK